AAPRRPGAAPADGRRRPRACPAAALLGLGDGRDSGGLSAGDPESLGGPGQAVPALRRPRLPLREGRVGLTRHARLLLDACAVAEGELRTRVGDPFLAGAPAGHEDHAGALARAHEDVLRLRRAVDEVPGVKPPLLALDQE